MLADRFATVRKGKIISLTEACPAHELKENQIPLTPQEYKILHALPIREDSSGIDFDAYFRIMDSILRKLAEV